jgi:membrane-associated protease RseP (regulator of RpoE activity)
LLYIVLHEGGHALVAVLCGAKITKFSITGAYMSYDGGLFSAFTLSLLNAAGMLLPVALTCLYILFYRKDAQGLFRRVLSMILCAVPLFSIFAWVVVPVLYLFDAAPQNDDVIRFIVNSGLHPLLVVLFAFLLFGFMVAAAWRRRIIQNYWQALKSLTPKAGAKQA